METPYLPDLLGNPKEDNMENFRFASTRFEVSVYEASDCLVFTASESDYPVGICMHGETLAKHTVEMVAHTKAQGFDKFVIAFSGCCDTDTGSIVEVCKITREAGVSFVWLNPTIHDGFYCWDGEEVIQSFAHAEKLWKGCKGAEEVAEELAHRDDCVARGKKHNEDEAALLKQYPVVMKVEAIESHYHKDKQSAAEQAFYTFFGNQLPIVSKVNCVALFDENLAEGVLVTKSQTIHFSVVGCSINRDTLLGRGKGNAGQKGYTKGGAGSIRIEFGPEVPQVSLYCHPGSWKVTPVGLPHVSHCSQYGKSWYEFYFEPMWQRLYNTNA